MLGWIGAGISAVSKLGGQWLENKQQLSKAESDYRIAVLHAKSEQAKDLVQAEMQQRQQSFSLDEAAVRAAAKTWWDEFLVLIFLSPAVLAMAGIVLADIFPEWGGADWGLRMVAVLEGLPLWYQGLLALILVRYLGFRGVLRDGAKLWLNRFGKKGNNVSN